MRVSLARRAVAARLSAAFLAVLVLSMMGLGSPARAADPRGVWVLDQKAAVRIFDCGAALCGRIVWLDQLRDQTGEIKRDRRNPDPSLRERSLCGLDVLSGLRGKGADSWDNGSFYNPQDGRHYDARLQMQSNDVMVARFFVGLPALGRSKVLHRLGGETADDIACHAATQTASSQPLAPGQ